MQYDVFISYARKDYVDEQRNRIRGNVITRLIDTFRSRNIKYWIDEEGICAGDKFKEVIDQNISESHILLFVSTHNSNSSEWVAREIAIASKYNKKIIPFRCDFSHFNESVSGILNDLDFVNYKDNPRRALDELVEDISQYVCTENDRKRRELEKERYRLLGETQREERLERLKSVRQKIQDKKTLECDIDKSILEQSRLLADLYLKKNNVVSEIQHLSQVESFLSRCISNSTPEERRGKIYSVGQYYDDGDKQGIVISVTNGGYNGVIISLEEVQYSWAECNGAQYDSVAAYNEDDGLENCEKILNRYDRDDYLAIRWCSDLGAGWYLPAINELMVIDTGLVEKINTALKVLGYNPLRANCNYWSSSESPVDSNCCMSKSVAWSLNFYADECDISDKHSRLLVRAFAKF